MSPQVTPGAATPAGPSGPAGGKPVNPLLAGPFLDTSGALQPDAVRLVTPITVFYILAIISIGLRIWAKRIKKNALRFNDYAIFVAAVFATGYLAIIWLVCRKGGMGWKLINVPLDQRKLTQQCLVIAWLLQAWGNSFVRLSILDFFATIFRISRFRIVVYIFEGLAVAYLVGCTITWFAICRPIQYNWTPDPIAIKQHCGNLNMKFLLSSIFNLVLDFGILILPMPMLWTLQLNARKKVALTVVFGLGIFVCFVTAWRTYNVVQFSKPIAKLNFTQTAIDDALWSGLEITLGIINACMPVMHPALQKMFGVPFNKLLSLTSTWRSSGKASKYTSSSGNSKLTNNTIGSGKPQKWRRLDESGNSSISTTSKHGITQEYTIDIEAQSMDEIPMARMGQSEWEHEPKR
ncbi:hypothetical protein N0V90_012116 [Kalmusia sp. IMI 367209]|nr:hypothetical protein N0V90_012116 [Kalmusia sp. IMI 367209]